MANSTRDLLLEQARTSLEAGRPADARRVLMQAVRLDSRHADAWYLLALSMDDRDQARDALARALKLDPFHAEARVALLDLDESRTPAPVREPQPAASAPERTGMLWERVMVVPASGAELATAPPQVPTEGDEAGCEDDDTQPGGLGGRYTDSNAWATATPSRPSLAPFLWSKEDEHQQNGSLGSYGEVYEAEEAYAEDEWEEDYEQGLADEDVQTGTAAINPTPAAAAATAVKACSPRLPSVRLRAAVPYALAAIVVLVALFGVNWWLKHPRRGPEVNTDTSALYTQDAPLVRPDWLTEAIGLRWQNRLGDAEATLRARIDVDGGDTLAPASLSLLLGDQLGRGDDAVTAGEWAVERASDPAHQAYAAFALVSALEAQREPPDVLRMRTVADRAVAAAPRNVYAQLALSRASAASGDWSRSMSAAREAVNIAAEDEKAEAWVGLARAAWEQSEYGIAEEAYGKALEQRDYGPWQLERALLIAEQKRFDEAAIIAAHGRSLVPDLANGAYAEATNALLRGDYAAAETVLATLSAALPSKGYADLLRGHLAFRQGKWAAATDFYSRAAQDSSLALVAQVRVADTLSAAGDCTGAWEPARSANEAAPDWPASLLAVAYAHLCAGDPDSALTMLRRAIRNAPMDSEVYLAAAAAESQQGQIEPAIDYFVKAIQYAPTLTGIHPSLSDLYLHGDDPLGGLRARFHAEIALELDPSDPNAHAAFGRLLAAARRPQQASEAFQAALDRGKSDPQTQIELAEALLAAGQADRAVGILEPLAWGENGSLVALYALARGYRSQGRHAEAQAAMQALVAAVGEAELPAGVARFAEALFDPNGYLVAREQIAGAVQPMLAAFEYTNVAVSVANVDGQDWLVLSAPADGAPDDEEQLTTASILMIAGAMPFARMSPPLGGGVRVDIVQPDGSPSFSASLRADLARDYSDGLLLEEHLLGSMVFRRAVVSTPTMDAARATAVGRELAEHRHLALLQEVPFNTIAREELAARFARDGNDARTQAAMRAAEALYKLLGLLGPADSLAALQSAASTDSVAGFYEPEEAAFYLVTDTSGNDPVQDEITVAHEYQHALQDQHWGLELFSQAADGDQQRAFQALAEGEATYTSFNYAFGHIPLFDLLGAFSAVAQADEARLEASPRYVRSTILFPYETGYAFVAAVAEDHTGKPDWYKMDRLFARPPRSTEQVLHPEKYDRNDEPKRVALPDLAPLGPDWHVESEDVLGELSLSLLIEPFTGHAIAARAADGWGGDRYAVLADAQGRQALVLRMVWDDEEEADEFWHLWPLYLRHRPTFRRLIADPLGEVHARVRWWQGPDQVIFAHRDSSTITVVVGPDRVTLEPLAASLPANPWERDQQP